MTGACLRELAVYGCCWLKCDIAAAAAVAVAGAWEKASSVAAAGARTAAFCAVFQHKGH